MGTKNGTSKKTNMMKMIQTVCKRISDGGYVIPPAEDAVTSTLRGVVDHYHRVEFCDIPKSGTTSWLVMFYKLTEKERAQRTKWFSRHPYSWLGQAPSDGYRLDSISRHKTLDWFSPLSPHDALKHHFKSLKTDVNFLGLEVLKRKFP